MDTFRWVAVGLSMILGLGVTRLLTSAVSVIRSRHHAEVHWMPLVWATSIFVLQLQFWWGVIELAQTVEVWTLEAFLLLLAIPLLLFVAAAMVLPIRELDRGESLLAEFTRDGRWGLACLAAYALLAAIADYVLFDLWEPTGADLLLAIEFVLPLVVLVIPRHPKLAGTMTVSYLLLVTWSSWTLSPRAYGP
jgi:hypothetical protein